MGESAWPRAELAMGKLKVLYFLHQYPQISQTYVENEISALGDDYEVTVIAANPPDASYANHRPYRLLPRGHGPPRARPTREVRRAALPLDIARVLSGTRGEGDEHPVHRACALVRVYVPEHKPAPRHLVGQRRRAQQRALPQGLLLALHEKDASSGSGFHLTSSRTTTRSSTTRGS